MGFAAEELKTSKKHRNYLRRVRKRERKAAALAKQKAEKKVQDKPCEEKSASSYEKQTNKNITRQPIGAGEDGGFFLSRFNGLAKSVQSGGYATVYITSQEPRVWANSRLNRS